jgi:predicted DNA-binding transcriptional regulator AlpA
MRKPRAASGVARPKKPPFPRPPKAVKPSKPVEVPGPVTLLTKKELLAKLRVTNVTLWDWIRKGHFPAGRIIGPDGGSRSMMVWIESEVDNFITNAPRRLPKGSLVTP